MQELEQMPEQTAVTPTEPASQPVTPLADAAKLADDQDDSSDAIFLRAIATIPTQPLAPRFTPQWEIDRQLERACLFTLLLVLLSLLALAILNIRNQPVITVTVWPVHQFVQLTTTIAVETRTLAPVTITRTVSAPTTGKGHQDARAAAGTLTLYNGLFTAQTIAQGTVFTGAYGVKVVTEQAVTIPASTPPQDGQATVEASALKAGAAGNIQAGDIHSAIGQGVLVTNRQFTGGRNARDYQAVAKHDLDSLTVRVQEQLLQAIPQAFSVRLGEAVHPTHCTTRITPDHGIREETQTLHVSASQTCGGVVYSQDELTRKAISVFNATRPGRAFEQVGKVQITILSISPLVVMIVGSWSAAFSQDDEQALAQHLQGETPAQAAAYLLNTGRVSRVTITPTETLPDWYHIKLLILIGG